MDPLMYEGLSSQQRADLARLIEAPGWAVVKLLLDDACSKTLQAIIKVNPEDVQYDEKVKARQLVSRVTNDVCATLLKSVVMHSERAVIEKRIEEARKNAEDPEGVQEEAQPIGEKFGSFKIKPRKVAKPQSNQ